MIRVTALGLTVLTGFSALVYQVAWQKYLAILLGSHSEAVAAVLAIFLGGLAAGYSLFGRITRQQVERARVRGEALRLLGFYGPVKVLTSSFWNFMLRSLLSYGRCGNACRPMKCHAAPLSLTRVSLRDRAVV